MKYRINRTDAERGVVDVTFSAGGRRHRREVNAVLDESGAVDRAATASRLEEVALGVAAKIAAGVL